MTELSLADVVERLFVAGVAMTTRVLSEATPDLDLTFPQWRVLLIVGEKGDGATVSEVAMRVGVTVPATSRQLRRLARRDLLVISRDPRDRRAARAMLTESGLAVRSQILGDRHRRIAVTTTGLRVSRSTLVEFQRVAGAFDDYR